MGTWTWYEIAALIAALIFAFFVIRGAVKGWQAENELMAPNGQKDDMEAADKRKKSR